MAVVCILCIGKGINVGRFFSANRDYVQGWLSAVSVVMIAVSRG